MLRGSSQTTLPAWGGQEYVSTNGDLSFVRIVLVFRMIGLEQGTDAVPPCYVIAWQGTSALMKMRECLFQGKHLCYSLVDLGEPLGDRSKHMIAGSNTIASESEY